MNFCSFHHRHLFCHVPASLVHQQTAARGWCRQQVRTLTTVSMVHPLLLHRSQLGFLLGSLASCLAPWGVVKQTAEKPSTFPAVRSQPICRYYGHNQQQTHYYEINQHFLKFIHQVLKKYFFLHSKSYPWTNTPLPLPYTLHNYKLHITALSFRRSFYFPILT